MGYRKGDRLLVGKAISNSNLTGVSVLYPFSFYRYDSNGLCYQQNNNLSMLQDQEVRCFIDL